MSYSAIQTIIRLISYLPLPVGRFLGRMLGTALSMIPMERTVVSLENIRKSFADSMGMADAKRLNRRVILHFGQMLFEIPHIMRMNKRNLEKYVRFDGEENLAQALRKGKGLFLLTGHFGNWELMAAAVSLRFGPLAIVARSFDFKPLDRFMTDLRSRFRSEIIPKQRAMRRILKTIKQNRMVGILMDQNVDWYEGAFVRFLGRWACANKGLALMAQRTGASVVPVFPVRQDDGRYCVTFGKEIRLIRTGDRTKDVEDNTALFTSVIEDYVRRYPDHWFWFHRRWKTRPYCTLPDNFFS